MDLPPVQYATSSDGLDIAYMTYGDGLMNLVVIPAYVSNLDIWPDFLTSLVAQSHSKRLQAVLITSICRSRGFTTTNLKVYLR